MTRDFLIRPYTYRVDSLPRLSPQISFETHGSRLLVGWKITRHSLCAMYFVKKNEISFLRKTINYFMVEGLNHKTW